MAGPACRISRLQLYYLDEEAHGLGWMPAHILERIKARVYPFPLKGRPRLGARMVVQSGFNRTYHPICAELSSWQDAPRLHAAALLRTYCLYLEDYAARMLHKVRAHRPPSLSQPHLLSHLSRCLGSSAPRLRDLGPVRPACARRIETQRTSTLNLLGLLCSSSDLTPPLSRASGAELDDWMARVLVHGLQVIPAMLAAVAGVRRTPGTWGHHGLAPENAKCLQHLEEAAHLIGEATEPQASASARLAEPHAHDNWVTLSCTSAPLLHDDRSIDRPYRIAI